MCGVPPPDSLPECRKLGIPHCSHDQCGLPVLTIEGVSHVVHSSPIDGQSSTVPSEGKTMSFPSQYVRGFPVLGTYKSFCPSRLSTILSRPCSRPFICHSTHITLLQTVLSVLNSEASCDSSRTQLSPSVQGPHLLNLSHTSVLTLGTILSALFL